RPRLHGGHSALEEDWDAALGTASCAHAWSATPTYDLGAHILGVLPTAPGYAMVDIRPLFGDLQRVSGKVPTPRGLIEVDVGRDGGRISVPQGVTAQVGFEDADLVGGQVSGGVLTVGK